MSERWSGDGVYYLPARQVEPYRLWFEFLKLAHIDPEIHVDYDHYADWGPFWEMSFNHWWSGARWRGLFAVDAGVRIVEAGTSVEKDDQAIIVRLPLSKDPRETLADVEQLLEQHKAGVRLDKVVQGRFALSEGYEKAFLKYLEHANFMLRLYRLWLKYQDLDPTQRVRLTALDFYDWAKARDDQIRERGYKYTRPMFPFSVRAYAEAIRAGEAMTGSDERRQFMRYLKKARSLAGNAASGVFPGKY